MSAEFHDLLRKVANPEAHDLDDELTFRVQHETLRAISLNGNAEVAVAAFRGGRVLLEHASDSLPAGGQRRMGSQLPAKGRFGGFARLNGNFFNAIGQNPKS
jgi:hypothetical protein